MMTREEILSIEEYYAYCSSIIDDSPDFDHTSSRSGEINKTCTM